GPRAPSLLAHAPRRAGRCKGLRRNSADPSPWLPIVAAAGARSAQPRRGGAVVAALLPDGEALDDDHAAAVAASTEPKLIAPREAFREKDCVLERDRGRGDHGGVGLERGAERVSACDVRKGGAGGRGGLRRHQPREGEKARQDGGFLLDPQRAGEVGGLVGRLAAMAGNITGGASEIGPIELADAIVTEARPDADRLGARLVCQKTQRQLQALPIALVAVFRDAHGRFPRRLCDSAGGETPRAYCWEIFPKTQPVHFGQKSPN